MRKQKYLKPGHAEMELHSMFATIDSVRRKPKNKCSFRMTNCASDGKGEKILSST